MYSKSSFYFVKMSLKFFFICGFLWVRTDLDKTWALYFIAGAIFFKGDENQVVFLFLTSSIQRDTNLDFLQDLGEF